MDDNIWEYPFGELDEDDDMFYREPKPGRDKNIPKISTRYVIGPA